MVGFGSRGKNLEAILAVVFSALIFTLFFSLVGSNGLILGNDPAVHLIHAQSIIDSGKISLTDIANFPPLFHIILDTLMAFTGVTEISQVLILMKATTALINWLVVFSVYLIATKFFNKKAGIFAASLLMLGFPLYEINSWGGYTSVLALSYMTLAFLYLAWPAKGAGNTLVAFVFAFSAVLSHQLVPFMAVFILPPFIIAALLKSKGNFPKALLAALLGGGIAFGAYYLIALLPYTDVIIFALFQMTLYQYQITAVTLNAYIVNFGFIILFALAGLVVAFFELRKRKALNFFILLASAFLVPLLFSQAYLFGIYLPFQWFVYYMLPPLVVLAGVSLTYIFNIGHAAYSNNKKGFQHNLLKVLSIIIICTLIAVMAVRIQTLTYKIDESTQFYSISDMSAYDAGNWIRKNYADSSATVVVTQQPGHWFGIYSGKPLIAQTDEHIDWNVKAESVLALSYEIQTPTTMLRAYEEKASNISYQNYIYDNMVWKPLSYFDEDKASLHFSDQKGNWHLYELSSLNRTIVLDAVSYPKSISIRYVGEEFTLAQNIMVANNSYPLTITWQLSATQGDITSANLHLNYYMDPKYAFENAYLPRILNWTSPWENFSRTADGWAITDFSKEDLAADKYVSMFDPTNKAAFALKFDDAPNKGSMGVLANNNIDKLEFEYHFYKIDAGYTVSKTYQLMTVSQTSTVELENIDEANSLFDFKTAEPFKVDCRNFASIISSNYIGFIVYDVNHFDPSLLNTKWIEIVYSNDKYIVCIINPNHPHVIVMEKSAT